jgi:hypothetical protein
MTEPNPDPKDSSLMVCLAYWEGDWAMAREVARLLSDLLPSGQSNVEFLFQRRFDCEKPDAGIVRHCEEKFARVHVRRSRRKGVGFPMGCNELAFDLFDFMFCNRHDFPHVDGVLLIEADCVMLSRTWNHEFIDEWRRAQTAGKLVCGTFIPTNSNGGKFHINATAIYRWDILKHVPALVGGPGTVGWDWYHGTRLHPVGHDTPLIHLDYRRKSITPEELFSPIENKKVPVLYHGVKDDSAIRAVRERFGI